VNQPAKELRNARYRLQYGIQRRYADHDYRGVSSEASAYYGIGGGSQVGEILSLTDDSP
jgi:hypothetical protein